MYLKRIELNGFKSFPNKREIHITEGITGVVGPNGSGKSNIADAMRWVLGEQSSKNLRGTTMQDVIFNGTQSRPQKGYCEVALIFDNEDNQVRSDYSEICVRRKMYRSGESEFSINNANCRLKDILELFRDTGIGKEGYSIIGQGRIDEILNSKAVQRRRVFEEAAGIMKYRVRKEEAERNLVKTKDNITRIDDILAELELQVGPLEEQMKEAKVYMAGRERLKELEVNMFLYNYERTADRIVKIEQQVKEQEQEYDDVTKLLEELSQKQVEVKNEIGAMQQDIDGRNARLSELMQLQEKLKGDKALLDEKESNLTGIMEANTQKCEGVEGIIRQNQEKISEIDGQVQELNTLLDEKYEKIRELEQSVQAMSGERDSHAQKVESLRGEVEAARVELQTRNIDISEARVRAELLEKQCVALEEQRARIKGEADEARSSLQKLKGDLQAFDEDNNKLRSAVNELAQAVQEAGITAANLDGKYAEARERLSSAQSRHKLLSEMIEGYEGYFESVRRLMEEAAGEHNISRKIKGVFADLVDVPKEYETAIEIILGNSLQNVVVDTDQSAKEIIDFLRKRDIGRVTFLPTQSLRVNYLKKDEKQLLHAPGVVGVASELIDCPGDIRPAVDFLLARTVVVEDMDSAIALMRKADYGFRTVTLKGDFINPGGSMTGGSTKKTGRGLLARKRMAEELEGQIGGMEKDVLALQSEKDKLAKDIEVKKVAQKEKLDLLRQLEIEYAELKQKNIAAEGSCKEKDASYAAACEELEGMLVEKQRMGELQDAEGLNALQESFESLEKQLRESEARITAGAKENEAVREMLAKLLEEQAQASSQKAVLLKEKQHLSEAVTAAVDSAGEATRQNDTLAIEINEIISRKEEIGQKLDGTLEEIKNVDGLTRDVFEKREKLSAEQQENEQKALALSERKNLLIEQKYRLAANKEKTELARETAQTKIWEDYGLTYANAQELKSEGFAYQSSAREIEEIREQLRGMDSVNPNAIEDYARVRERYDKLTVQRDDLVKASEDLQVVIGDLLVGMKASFKEKFAQINSNFVRVFEELFGGGHAQLELLDEDDIMECGIEIIAEPPGKKLQNISLLSGGEKALTAIALLFAMLAINPSPVCLLDEIDAPLDDANLIRLADYLTRLAKELQFIVITHRKPTMAICDTLYGVAMNERGVSDVVSVKLDDFGAAG